MAELMLQFSYSIIAADSYISSLRSVSLQQANSSHSVYAVGDLRSIANRVAMPHSPAVSLSHFLGAQAAC